MKIKLIIAALLFAVIVGIPMSANVWSVDHVTFTVNKAERITKGDSSYYLVFTDKGEFKNVDSFLNWKWNSSEIYGNMEKGKQFKCSKNWWRVEFLSMYENLITCSEVK